MRLHRAGDLAGVQIPAGLDSISLYPTITGQPSSQHAADYLYWEFYEQGSRQAMRAGTVPTCSGLRCS